MSNVQVAEAKTRERLPLNGVDTPTLFATINAVKAQPELARFQFRAINRWVKGTHSRSWLETFSGAGGEHRRTGDVRFDADHPAVLVGGDQAPTPVEFLLHAITACITAGIGNIAAARGVRLTEVESWSKETSISAVFSACRTRCGTAINRCGSISASQVTRPQRSSRKSSRRRRRARRCSTC
jgi:OsmC-like protein